MRLLLAEFPICEKSYLRFMQIFRLKPQEMQDIRWRNRRHFELQENRRGC